MRSERYYNLLDVIDEIHPITLIEIGCHRGYTGREMIERALDYQPEVNYCGFDLFEDFTAKIKQIELGKKTPCTFGNTYDTLKRDRVNIKLYKGYTKKTLPDVFIEKGLSWADMIFIDGGHSIATIQNDWEWSYKFIRNNGIIILDDFYIKETKFGCSTLIHKLLVHSKKTCQVKILEPMNIEPCPVFKILRKIKMVKVKVLKDNQNDEKSVFLTELPD